MKLSKSVDDALFLLSHPSLVRWVPRGLQLQPNKAYRATWLRDLDFKTIIDVGANSGQAAINFCTVFPGAAVHSFEPIPESFSELSKLTSHFDRLSVHNFALGNETGDVSFNLNEYTPASSILQMSDEHITSFPNAVAATKITVPIKRLDDVVGVEFELAGTTLVKIDVQGYEGEVLAGGGEVIKQAAIVVVETSIESMYDGDSSFADLYATLSGLGFTYRGALEQLIDERTGRVLQQDAIFLNTNTVGSELPSE